MSNFFPVGKIGANTTYSLKSECELAEGQECFDITGKDLRYVKITPVPVMTSSIVIVDPTGQPVLDVDGNYTYTISEQAKDSNGNLVFENILVDDFTNKPAHDAADLYEKRISDKARNMHKAAYIIGLVAVMNEDKGLTGAQMVQFAQTFAPIQALLQSGSLLLARAAIQAIIPDGVLVTQADKDKILIEIDKKIAE